ncbi:hypothetical protein AB205_0112410, partial [Aquarana catesbeiana]
MFLKISPVLRLITSLLLPRYFPLCSTSSPLYYSPVLSPVLRLITSLLLSPVLSPVLRLITSLLLSGTFPCAPPPHLYYSTGTFPCAPPHHLSTTLQYFPLCSASTPLLLPPVLSPVLRLITSLLLPRDFLLCSASSPLYYSPRFFPLSVASHAPCLIMAIYPHRYDSLTGVPSCQRALAFEKGSVLFNMGALYTQIAARQDRLSVDGVDTAIDAFQKAAGCFNYLKENFSNAPSLDMSAASLNMLVRLMVAQVQECIFEKSSLASNTNSFLSQVQMAQEAARVEDVYTLVYRTMMHPPVKDYVPFSWTTMVRVKAEHFKALSHYHAENALCDFTTSAGLELIEHEKVLLQFHTSPPEGPSISCLLQDQEERRKL